MSATIQTTPVGIQEPPRTLGLALLQIGPGLILAGAIVGTGELIQTTQLGARAGFALLWLVILSCFIKVFVQIELGRFAVSTGQTTFGGFRSLPGPGMLLVWWCSLMVLVTQFQIGAMIGGVGQAIHMIVPGTATALSRGVGTLHAGIGANLAARPELPWAVVITAITIAMLATGSYRLIERGMTLLVVVFTIMTVVCVLALPVEFSIRWEQVASGLTFQLPKEALGAAFAMFGITGVGATELLTYPYWCIEKGYARYTGPSEDSPAWVDRARGWLAVMKLDAWVSMVIYTISTLAFFLLGASVLHRHTDGRGLPGTVGEMLDVLARMYEPVLGAAPARWFLVIGAFAVLYSTLFAATAGTSRLLADFLRVNQYIAPHDQAAYRWWTRFFCAVLPLCGLGLFIGVANPVLMVKIGGVMQALTLPLIATAAVFLRYRRTDRRITPGLIWDVFLWASMIGLTCAAAYTLLTSASDLWALLGR